MISVSAIVNQVDIFSVPILVIGLLLVFAGTAWLSFSVVSSRAGSKAQRIFAFAVCIVLIAFFTYISYKTVTTIHKVGDHVTPTPSNFVPAFPWPPPTPSTRWSFLINALEESSRLNTFKDMDWLLCGLLNKADYSDVAYFDVPGGFALVTQIECIDENGCPEPGPRRFQTNAPPLRVFSLDDIRRYIKKLISPDANRYRVIVFIISEVPFSTPNGPPDIETTTSWLKNGLNVLPAEIGSLPINSKCTCSILIYEFVKAASDGAISVVETSNQNPRKQAGLHRNYSSHEKSMKKYRQKLTTIWFVGTGVTFFLLVIQTLLGRYGSSNQEVFGWFLPTIMPTLLLISGVWVAEVSGRAAQIPNPDQFLFRLTMWLSIAYLFTVALIVLIQPFTSVPALELMKVSHLFLGPFQGLVAGVMGAFFVAKTE